MSDAVFESYLDKQGQPVPVVLTEEEREAVEAAIVHNWQLAADYSSETPANRAKALENLLARAGTTENKTNV